MSKSSHEHGFDCCEFMTLSAPHMWSCIQDFMHDTNSTFDGNIPFSLDETIRVNGTCGVHPDEACCRRDAASEATYFETEIKRVGRLTWLSCQLEESLRIGCVLGWNRMNKKEQLWFMRQWIQRKPRRPKQNNWSPIN